MFLYNQLYLVGGYMSPNQLISDILDNQGPVDVIYSDFSKVFDIVDHSNLNSKWPQMGFSNGTLALVTNYLNSNRQSIL